MSEIYQFRIRLEGSRPSIWRLVEMPLDIPLIEVHRFIQGGMPWGQAHLFRFERDDQRWKDPEFVDRSDPNTHSVQGVTLGDVLGEHGRRIGYVYDFGDHWEHGIWRERPVEPVQDGEYPRLVGGERAAPPEDVGGIWRYNDIAAKLRNEQHDELREYGCGWLVDRGFDPDEFPFELESDGDSSGEGAAGAELEPDWRPQATEEAEYLQEVDALIDDLSDDYPFSSREVRWAVDEFFTSEDGLPPAAEQVLEAVPEQLRTPFLLEIVRDSRHSESGVPIFVCQTLVSFESWAVVDELGDIVADIADPSEPLCNYALYGLQVAGERAVSSVLELLEETDDRRMKLYLLAILSRMDVTDERICEALVEGLSLFDDDTHGPVDYLVEYGDERAIEPLRAMFEERIEQALDEHGEKGPRELREVSGELSEAYDTTERLALSIERLGGEMSDEEDESQAQLFRLMQKSSGARGRTATSNPVGGQQTPSEADEEPGRNDPCPCGSGRKYKKCCLRKR